MFLSAPAALVSSAFVIDNFVFLLTALKHACLAQSINAVLVVFMLVAVVVCVWGSTGD